MNLSKDDLSKVLSKSLEKELRSFADRHEIVENGNTSKPLQSNLLLDAELPAPSCDLGVSLMKELLDPQVADIILKVKDECFLCHKEVLTSRCNYFQAMFQNSWSEKDSNEIVLNNINPKAVAALLCFLYGASTDLPNFCPLLDILQIADMYGVSDLTSVVKYHIKVELCHSFHKPCKECIANAPEVIQLASLFSINDLLNSCLKWNTKYFYKLWPTKGFASMQVDLREKCLRAVEESLTITVAISLLMETDKLLSSITRVQWTKPVVAMGTKLMTSCCDFIASHFLQLTSNQTLMILFEGIGWKTDIVERILTQIIDDLNIDNVCNCHLAVTRLIYLADKEEWKQEFTTMLTSLKKKIWNFLVSNYFAVIHTDPWQRLSAADKMSLKSETLCQGDSTRKLSKRPVLSSSLNKKATKPDPSTVSSTPKLQQKKQTSKAKTTIKKSPSYGSVRTLGTEPRIAAESRSDVKPSSEKCPSTLDTNGKCFNEDASTPPPTLVPIILTEELLPGWIMTEEVVSCSWVMV